MDRLPPFQAFFDEHRDLVYRFLVARVGRAEAEDCFQETFMAALRAYPRLKEGANLRAWVLTIAERKSIDAHRSRGRRPLPHEDVPDAAGPTTFEVADPNLWAAVGDLPPKQRSAVVLRFVGDLPYSEIGAVIGSSEEAARQSVRDGLRNLRKVWER